MPFDRCRNRQILGVQRISARTSPNLLEKFLCKFCSQQIFSHNDHKELFLNRPPNKVFMCFSANLGRYFLIQATLGAFFTRIFRDFAQIFIKSNFLGCACTPYTPTSNNTAFQCSITVNFMLYQGRLETNLLHLFGHPENSE